jgi:hypothetical protein
MCQAMNRRYPPIRRPGGGPHDDQPAGDGNVFAAAERVRRERAAQQAGRKPPPPSIRTGRQVGPMAPASPQVAQEVDRRYRQTGRNPAGPFRL